MDRPIMQKYNIPIRNHQKGDLIKDVHDSIINKAEEEKRDISKDEKELIDFIENQYPI